MATSSACFFSSATDLAGRLLGRATCGSSDAGDTANAPLDASDRDAADVGDTAPLKSTVDADRSIAGVATPLALVLLLLLFACPLSPSSTLDDNDDDIVGPKKKMTWLLLSIVALSAAHICIIEPRQRGAWAITSAGSSNCYRRAAECGGVKPGPVTATYVAGDQGAILLQQNFNHWNGANQGFIDVAIALTNVANPTAADFVTLTSTLDYPAHEQVTQTNFTLPVTWPQKVISRAVLRVRYVTNNPDESVPNNQNSTFYNCADIALSATLGSSKQPAAPTPLKKDRAARLAEFVAMAHATHADLVARNVVPPASGPSVSGCCLPSRFTLAYEAQLRVRSTTLLLQREFEVDQGLQLQRFTQSVISGGGAEFNFVAISDYQKGVEYFLNGTSGACSLYGPDQWYPFCYGDQADNGTTQARIAIYKNLTVFANDDATWLWAVSNVAPTSPIFCVPVLQFFEGVDGDAGNSNTTFTLTSSSTTVNPASLTKPSNCK